MENKKKYGVIDLFTVFYCVVSTVLAFFVLGLFGLNTFNLSYVMLIAVLAPFVLDLVLTVIIGIVAASYKIYLKVKKWRHDKKNPPVRF